MPGLVPELGPRAPQTGPRRLGRIHTDLVFCLLPAALSSSNAGVGRGCCSLSWGSPSPQWGGGAGTPSSSCEAPAAPLRSPLCSSRFPGTSTPAGRSAPPLAFSTPQSKDTRLKSASFPPLTCQGRDASPIPTSPVLTYSALPMERVAREGPPNPCWWLLRPQGNWPGPDPTLASCSPESASVVCRRAGREQLPGGGGGRCRGGTLSIAG